MWGHRLRKLASISPVELKLLVQAQWLLWRSRRQLRREPAGGLVTVAAGEPGAEGASVDPDAASLARARMLEQAIDRAANHGLLRPLCLTRARALHAMLEAHGLRGSRVVVGVQRARGSFGAHAWVEYGSEVLGDSRRHVDRYVRVSGVRVSPLQ